MCCLRKNLRTYKKRDKKVESNGKFLGMHNMDFFSAYTIIKCVRISIFDLCLLYQQLPWFLFIGCSFKLEEVMFTCSATKCCVCLCVFSLLAWLLDMILGAW